jgi:predicted phage tail protein
MEKLTLIKIKNPFNRAERDIVPVEYRGESLLEIRDANIPAGMPVAISINGQLIETTDDRGPTTDLSRIYPKAGDHILFMPVIEGGGGDNKSILRIVLMIVVAIVAPYVAPALGLSGMAATIMTGVVMIVGGLIVNALLPPPKPTMPTLGTIDNSYTYGWNPQTVQQQGLAVPKWYGRNRLYGNITAANIETKGNKSYLNALVDLGLGPFQRLYDFKINDQPYENYKGVDLEVRLGKLDQPVVNLFVLTKNEYPMSIKVVKDTPYIYTTLGNAFHALEVGLTFPQGLFYANDAGSLDVLTVNYRLSIRRLGETAWRVLTSMVVTTEVKVYGHRWSAGKWVEQETGEGGNREPGGGTGGAGYGQAGDDQA